MPSKARSSPYLEVSGDQGRPDCQSHVFVVADPVEGIVDVRKGV